MTSYARSAVSSARCRILSGLNFVLKSFQTKFLALVLLSVLVPSGLIWMFTVRDTERFQTRQANEKFGAVLLNGQRDIQYWYKDRAMEINRLLQSSSFVDPLRRHYENPEGSTQGYPKGEVVKYLSIVTEKFPIFEEFVVLDRDGSVVVATQDMPADKQRELADLTSESRGEFHASSVHFKEEAQGAFQWLLVPVEAEEQKKFTVCVKMTLDGIGDLLDSSALGPGGDLYLLDDRGRFLTPPAPTTGTPLATIAPQFVSAPNTWEKDGSSIVERYYRVAVDKNGRTQKTKLVGSKLYLTEHRWWLVCEAAESHVIAPVVTRKNRLLAANVLICALFLLAAWRLSRYLLQPLSELSLGARRINEGMVGVKIPGAGEDEVGVMITAFNEMAERIALSEVQLQANNKLLETKNGELVTANDKLEMLSITDGLTKLFNHRHFWNLMEGEVEQADLYDGELGLLLIDIDNFKEVNDQFGHATGDLLIQRIAQVLKKSARAGESVARYGGEEFGVLAPDTDREGVMALAERIRSGIERMLFRVPDTGITLSVTVSIGASIHRGSRKEFFNAADRALYICKTKGKNRTSFAIAEVHAL